MLPILSLSRCVLVLINKKYSCGRISEACFSCTFINNHSCQELDTHRLQMKRKYYMQNEIYSRIEYNYFSFLK